MKEVAAAAGVTQSTVSRVLNDAPGRIAVSAKTRERVLAVARELGYRPHPGARSLRGAPSMLLGAVVRDIADPFFADVLATLTLEAKVHGYSVVLGSARATADEALALTAVLEARQCDAIVLVGDLRDEPLLVEDLLNSHVPVVALWHGQQQRGRRFATVAVDNRAGVRAALTHLTALGHRRIAFVGGDWAEDVRERKAGYVEYLSDTGLVQPDGYIRNGFNGIPDGELALAALLRLSPRPTAILTATDILAMGVIHAASESGVAVPEELSVVGFDDIPIAAGTVPGLTTVRMPTAEMVAASVELAVGNPGWREQRAGNPPLVIFQPKLITRHSTAAITPTAYGDRSTGDGAGERAMPALAPSSTATTATTPTTATITT
jgi:DNA-binding LacI/PurR family transcriptional regulator